ncbi:TetR/AcrR family transcriptional regulator [Brachybacterium halotolerans subsp. kimchii]|uniref:TetR/AcrR family transcriptional regulator n=1 Tax=Brachybacterium halotolerans TaxID=2795215 RepID=UPI001E5C5961|nr:TetR/AcrR family transcriptional regulator [Brachybacterium halotolerans]UEJ83208.1 TetR/AcrR family transcriptional regulator [Brachybacterium halotolerans subsp. kimchii]
MEAGHPEVVDPVPDLLGNVPAGDETRRKENTRSRLVRASVQVFAEKGLDGATIDDLVRAAGFTRGAFYSNFSSKDEVFRAAFALATQQVIQIMHERVDEARAAHGPLGSVVPGSASGGAADEGARTEEAALMLDLFEAMRPFGRQWCLLHTEAVTHSLRSQADRDELVSQRRLLRSTVAGVLASTAPGVGPREGLDFEDLAQLLIGVFIDLITREQLEGEDVSALASTTILGTLRAFLQPGEEGAAGAVCAGAADRGECRTAD